MVNLIQPITIQQAYVGLLTHGGENYEISDGGWLMTTTAMISPLWSPKRTPDLPSRGRTGLDSGSIL